MLWRLFALLKAEVCSELGVEGARDQRTDEAIEQPARPR